MIRAIAIDDEPPALRVLEIFCQKVAFVDLQQTFTRPSEALAYLAAHPVDLVFVDIQMPTVGGVDLAKQLGPGRLVVFTTAHSQYAVEGFNLNAADYLLKPFTFQRFGQAMAKVQAQHTLLHAQPQDGPRHILIRADYQLHRVDLADILYIEGLDDYLKIYRVGQPPLVARLTMKAVAALLPPAEFVRVHRSYIVPLRLVSRRSGRVLQVGAVEVPIGASYEAEVSKLLRG
jgi:DNA-binding LytR/AlgR family response regulator